jgi:Type II secretory pathway, pullulanase PulA and related glycosidases
MRATDTYVCLDGQPWPMGATPMSWQGQDGVNFAVHAPQAEGMDCCLFDENCDEQKASLPLPRCTDGVWHGFVPQLGVGQLYGLRASGPYAPDAGHRFNRHKLLVDPYAKELVGPRANLAREVDYSLDPSGQRTADTQDNAGRIPKTRVIDSTAELRLGAGIAPGPSHSTVSDDSL